MPYDGASGGGVLPDAGRPEAGSEGAVVGGVPYDGGGEVGVGVGVEVDGGVEAWSPGLPPTRPRNLSILARFAGSFAAVSAFVRSCWTLARVAGSFATCCAFAIARCPAGLLTNFAALPKREEDAMWGR